MIYLFIVAMVAGASIMLAIRLAAGQPHATPIAKISSVAVRAIIGATILTGLGILLLGIPGGLFLEAINTIYQAAGSDRLRAVGDGMWPMAIFLSLLFPWTLPPAAAWFIRNRPATRTPAAAYAFGLGATLVVACLEAALLLAAA